MNRYAEIVSPLRAHFSRLRYFAVKPFFSTQDFTEIIVLKR